jgi:hypothetical protein
VWRRCWPPRRTGTYTACISTTSSPDTRSPRFNEQVILVIIYYVTNYYMQCFYAKTFSFFIKFNVYRSDIESVKRLFYIHVYLQTGVTIESSCIISYLAPCYLEIYHRCWFDRGPRCFRHCSSPVLWFVQVVHPLMQCITIWDRTGWWTGSGGMCF